MYSDKIKCLFFFSVILINFYIPVKPVFIWWNAPKVEQPWSCYPYADVMKGISNRQFSNHLCFFCTYFNLREHKGMLFSWTEWHTDL